MPLQETVSSRGRYVGRLPRSDARCQLQGVDWEKIRGSGEMPIQGLVLNTQGPPVAIQRYAGRDKRPPDSGLEHQRPPVRSMLVELYGSIPSSSQYLSAPGCSGIASTIVSVTTSSSVMASYAG